MDARVAVAGRVIHQALRAPAEGNGLPARAVDLEIIAHLRSTDFDILSFDPPAQRRIMRTYGATFVALRGGNAEAALRRLRRLRQQSHNGQSPSSRNQNPGTAVRRNI